MATENPDFFHQPDANRTDLLAGPALGAEIGDISHRGQVGGQQDADGPGLDPAIEVRRP